MARKGSKRWSDIVAERLGDLMAYRRAEAGQSKIQAARALGVHRVRYAKLESGKARLELDELEMIMDHYGIRPDEILPRSLKENVHVVDVPARPGEQVQVIINLLEPAKGK